MDNSQDKTVINKTAVTLVASQIFVREASGEQYRTERSAAFSIAAAEDFIKELANRGYNPGTLLTSGVLL